MWQQETIDQLLDLSKTEYNDPGLVNEYSAGTEEGFCLVEKEMLEILLSLPSKVLVVGCSTGRECFALEKMGHDVVGVDVSESMIGHAKEVACQAGSKVSFFQGEITQWDPPAYSYDLILFSENLYSLIPSKKLRVKTIQQITSFLKPKGLFFILQGWLAKKKNILHHNALVFRMRALKRCLVDAPLQEPGDTLMKNSDGSFQYYFYYFQRPEELKKEFNAAGLVDLFQSSGRWVLQRKNEVNQTLSEKMNRWAFKKSKKNKALFESHSNIEKINKARSLVLQEYEEKQTVLEYKEDCSLGFYDYEKHFVETIRPNEKVLVVGCGAGRESFALAKQGVRVVGVDFSQKMIQAAIQLNNELGLNVEFIQADFSKLPKELGCFDSIILGDGLYSYIPSKKRRVKSLQNLKSYLHDQGKVFVVLGGLPERNSFFILYQIKYWVYHILKRIKRSYVYEFGDHFVANQSGDGAGYHYQFQHKGELKQEFKRAGYQIIKYHNHGWVLKEK